PIEVRSEKHEPDTREDHDGNCDPARLALDGDRVLEGAWVGPGDARLASLGEDPRPEGLVLVLPPGLQGERLVADQAAHLVSPPGHDAHRARHGPGARAEGGEEYDARTESHGR